ncbi:MAG: hypothetical protein H6658_08640 [Ardenticatenaceae bacterium]|nr:hypothetical protein [Ardenticatenaceae bacterium]
MKTNREILSRVLIAALILMSGLALIPYIELPQTALGWEQFAGIYAPELTVDPEIGRPASTFTATGSNYPPNSPANVYVDGNFLGTVMTDGNGRATFYISTLGSQASIYNVTMEVDANASATDNFELVNDGPFIPGPTVSDGPTFYLNEVFFNFLPFISN